VHEALRGDRGLLARFVVRFGVPVPGLPAGLTHTFPEMADTPANWVELLRAELGSSV
jgi:hypothetical protein